MPPVGGHANTTDETAQIRWITPAEIPTLMTPAYAIRVLDALADTTASRAHHGTALLARR